LHAKFFDYQTTLTEITQTIKKLHQSFPLTLNTTSDLHLITSGFLTVHGRDIHHRPVLLCQPMKLAGMKIDPIEILNPILFIMYYVKK